jgi:hypothetical protein
MPVDRFCAGATAAGPCNVRRLSKQDASFDFSYIGIGIGRHSYVLVLKDDFSSWTRLVRCKAATAVIAAEALVKWFSEFGVALTWVSDQGSPFKNKVIPELRQLTRGRHHFSLPYIPWC